MNALLSFLVEKIVLKKWLKPKQWGPDPPENHCCRHGPLHNRYEFEPTESQPTDYLPPFMLAASVVSVMIKATAFTFFSRKI